MLASAPRRQGGGAAHEVGRKRAAEAAEEERAAALGVTEQEEVGEQPVGDHGVHGVGLGRRRVRRANPEFRVVLAARPTQRGELLVRESRLKRMLDRFYIL